ncbi:MAG: ThuA domain-containing protein [Planctomycetaceae bacterium]|nr:ThuA domain-containing protein [Planctomycetaceae bacterium]
MSNTASKIKIIATLLLAFVCLQLSTIAQDDALFRVSLQSRFPSAEKDVAPGTLVVHQEIQHWNPKETAIIISDMWNQHWCQGATARVAELAPHMNEVLTIAREKGVLIVHAPSDTVNRWYQDHPARKRAQEFRVPGIERRLGNGNTKLDSEKDAAWPIDQSDEGCDCTPTCPHPSVAGTPYPWTHQIETLVIDEDKDIISDSGVEIGSHFEEKGIKNVIIMGVHTNMCVIGRSFALRNMTRLGKNVVLMRDMTDTMYNSKMAPFVSHFTGNSLMQQYIESYVAPSMVSTDFTGKKQFRFKDDERPLVAFVTADDEYRSNQRFHEFSHELLLTKGVNCDFAVGDPAANSPNRHNIENLQILEDADLVFLYVRRRALEAEKMDAVRKYVDSGKPLVGIRTASHAFSVREQISDHLVTWDGFDRMVFGGNYSNHLGRESGGTRVAIVPGMEGHPLLEGLNAEGFSSPSWLYINRPLRSPMVQVLLTGTAAGKPTEPVLWINHRPDGHVIYTSLGHWDDWEVPDFKRLMINITVGSVF